MARRCPCVTCISSHVGAERLTVGSLSCEDRAVNQAGRGNLIIKFRGSRLSGGRLAAEFSN